MEFKFKPIPVEYEITEKIKQDNFLINGNLVKWQGEFSSVYSTISSTSEYGLHCSPLPKTSKCFFLDNIFFDKS